MGKMKDKNIEMIEDFEKVFDKWLPGFEDLSMADKIDAIEDIYAVASQYVKTTREIACEVDK